MRYFRALDILRTTNNMPRCANPNGYAELGVVPPPFDSVIGGGKSAYAPVGTGNNKKNSLPRYEAAVDAEFVGVPPPPYEEKVKLAQ